MSAWVPELAVGVEPRSASTLPAVCASGPLADEPPRSAGGALAPVVAPPPLATWPEPAVVPWPDPAVAPWPTPALTVVR
ncbi:MAG TPA: hypothetical protein VNP03_07725 [Pseudonocardia sp.]|nr:hypothetical protein [Pseudonocardia sp.]